MFSPSHSLFPLRAARVCLLSAAVFLVAAGLSVVTANSTARAASPAPPNISPSPQSMTLTGHGFALPTRVGIVAGATADQAAVDNVEQTLQRLRVDLVVRRDGSIPNTPVTIYVGNAAETPSAAQALTQLAAAGPDGLPSEGYVLASGIGKDGKSRIVLAGIDGTGTFYATQTLRQVIAPRAGRPQVPGLIVRDWPAFGFRGGMESFYGPEWSQADRLAQLDFLAAHKMDTFFYGPAGDPRTGTLWNSPYDSAELARMQQVVDHAEAEHVNFIYRVSPEAPLQPSSGICHSRQTDLQELADRFEQLWSIGVRQFVIAWDDVAGQFTCAQDQQTYGTDPVPTAAAQTSVVNYIQQHFIDSHPGAKPLITVPTQYSGTQASAYRTRFDTLLAPSAQIYWTGPAVVSPTITVPDITATQQAYPNHHLVIWDNYPVNDYTTNRLLLGPLTGRDAGLAQHALGITFNEMQEQAPSQIVLATEADYAWNAAAYNSDTSWDRGLHEIGGTAGSALQTFAENNHSSGLDGQESPSLTPAIAAFRTAYTRFGGVDTAGRVLIDQFTKLRQAEGAVRAVLDPLFVSEADPWLRKAGLYGRAGVAAVGMLLAQIHGDRATALADRNALEQDRAQLAAIPQIVAPGVVDPFLDFARDESDSWLGVPWYGGIAGVTGTPAAAGSSLQAAADGDTSTVYRPATNPVAGDAILVTLTTARPLDSVLVLQAPTAVAQGTVDVRRPSGQWVTLGNLASPVTDVTGRGVVANAVRIRWTGGSGPSPVVEDIVPRYADALTARVSLDRECSIASAGSTQHFAVTVDGIAATTLDAALAPSVPSGWAVQPANQAVSLPSNNRAISATYPFTVSLPATASAGAYTVSFTATSVDGRHTPTASATVLVGAAASNVYCGRVLQDAPVGYWRFGEQLKTAGAGDTSGHGLTGSYVEPVAHDIPGAIAGDQDRAVDLTGGYVNVAPSPLLQQTGPFTLEAWVKPSAVATSPGEGIIERYDTPANNGYILRLDAGNHVQAWVLGPTQSALVTGATAIAVGSWHHLAAVFDGSHLTVYVDGKVDNTIATSITPGAGSGPLRLGARGDDANQRLSGGLDEVAVYDHALSASEIQSHYELGTGG